MKNRVSLWVTLLLLGGTVMFASRLMGQSAQGVTMLEGVMQVVEGSATNRMEKDLTLPNSIEVLTNGTFRVNGGKDRSLQEKQYLGADGMLLSPDGTLVPVMDHVAMIKNQVMLYKDGDVSTVREKFSFSDGSSVTPDGFFITKGGESLRLLDGLRFLLDGKPLPAKDTVTLKGGAVRLQTDGSPLQLARDRNYMMNDGTKIYGDGKVVKRNGTTLQLQEGQILIVDGVVHRYSK